MLTYTREAALSASLDYYKGDALAADVFVRKYALQDLQERYYELTPLDAKRRIGDELYRVECNYPNPTSREAIDDLLDRFSVNGSPYSGIGNPFQIQSISNCFVIESPYDSYGGIFLTDQEQVQIMKRRGGVGHDISTIRPRGLPAANAARTTDGIGIFMDRFSNSTREVAQEGRRGALMQTISVHHPEIMTFINIKKDLKRVTGANISVRCTDEFMRAVENDELYQLRFPVESGVPHIVEEWVKARDVWRAIAEAAWQSAEPGVLFWDTVIRMSPADCYADVGYGTKSTNPCGELPLCPYDSCRLAFMVLTKYVIDPYKSTARFDFEKFDRDVVVAQRMMDNIVDLELEMIMKIIAKIHSDPEPEGVKRIELDLWEKIYKTTAGGRRTGLGVTGLGDALAMLNLPYASTESEHVVEDIYQQLAFSSYASSVQMAEERGAFPVYDYSKEWDHPFISRIMDIDLDVKNQYQRFGRRNIANNTTAPVGSLSMLHQTASGIEPAIFIEFLRRRKINAHEADAKVDFVDDVGDSWQEYKTYHHGVKWWMEATGETDVTKSPYWGSTAEEIDPIRKVDIQAAAQRWIDHSISNTTNMPETATVEDVEKMYMHAWKTGCKGVTIYRKGSRSGVIIDEKAKKKSEGIVDAKSPKRPDTLPCDIHRASVKGQQYLIIVGLLEGRPYEIFAGLADKFEELGRKDTKGVITKHPSAKRSKYSLVVDGGVEVEDIVETFDNPNHGAFTRTLSAALRHGIPVVHMVEQLRKEKNWELTSFSAVISRVLSKHYIQDGTEAKIEKTCTDCGGKNLKYVQGCVTCFDCGGSKCS